MNSNESNTRDAVDGAMGLAQREQDLENRIVQHDQQRQQWECERQRALADLQQQAALLRDAWLRLENEQRRTVNAGNAMMPTSPSDPQLSNQPISADRKLHADCCQQASGSPSRAEQFQLLQQHVLAASNEQKPNAAKRDPGE